MIDDDQGGTAAQDVTVAINGTNDAPTAVGETIITDVGPNGLVQIQPWMLAANDTDPDLTDNLAFGSIQSSSDGVAVTFGDVFFVDDSTPGGSFTYTVVGRHRDQRQCGDGDRDQQRDLDHVARSAPAVTTSSSPPTAPRRSTAAAATTSWSAIPAAMS